MQLTSYIMARFNVLSLFFLLISVSFFIFDGENITGDFFGGESSFDFLNIVGITFLMLFFISFMAGKKLETILVPTGSHKADKERASEGAEYYEEHNNENFSILISGSVDGKFGKRFISSQPGHIYKYMRRKKVPRDSFLFEPKSKNTAENVVYSCKKIKEKGIKKVDVVSNPSHLWRFKFLFDKAKEEGLIDKDVEINYVPTERNFLFEDVGEAFYGVASYLDYLIKYHNKPLKTKDKK